MGVGVSLLLIAAGAILTWAVTAEASGVDLNTVVTKATLADAFAIALKRVGLAVTKANGAPKSPPQAPSAAPEQA